MKMVGKKFACLLAAATLSLAGFASVPPRQASAAGNTYYVDAVNGSDTSGNGSSGSPWKTIGKAADAAAAGDTVKIRSGTYRETVRPAHSGTAGNPITFQPDTGANVTVSGADLISGPWSVHSGNVYKTTAPLNMGDFLDSVYVDGVANFLARSPNTPVGNLYDPYTYKVEYPDTTNSVLVDSANLTQPDGTWDNAAVFIRDTYAWNFGGALGTAYTQGHLNLKTGQNAYNLELSSYDNALKLIGPGGAVLGSYSVTVQPNATYNLKVTASGSHLDVYLNNGTSPVISSTDSALTEGSFGLGVESNSSAIAATAQFANVNATIASQNPNQPTGRLDPDFASNLKGWGHGEEPGYWSADGTTLTGYTQPSMSTTDTWYYSNTTAKDFTYSADVKLTSASGGNVYLQFRKEEAARNVLDISYNDYYLNPNSLNMGNPEYYIMGSLAALDYPGEWYYDRATTTLYLRTTSSDSPSNHTVEAKARNLAFDLTDRSNVTIKGINLFAATIDMTGGENDVIDGIHAKYLSEFNKAVSYNTGLCLCGTNDTVMNSELEYSSGELVTVKGTDNKLINNKIHDGTYGPNTFISAVNIFGSGHLISHNEVYHSGRSLIGGDFYGVVIQYNDFHDGNYFATDTGLLYVAHNGLGNSEIHHNDWHGSGYRYNGANGVQGDWDAGIYLDEHSSDALVYDNVTWNLPWNGVIVNHLADNILVYNNTTYDHSTVAINLYNPDEEAYGIRAANNISLDGFNTGASAYGAQFDHNMTSGTPSYADPSGADFHLQAGSGAIDIGTPIRGITDGYTGTAPDAGAYEYGGTDWTAGADLAHPPATLPTYRLVDTDYKNLLVNGRLALNRILLPSMDSLYGWTKTNSMTAQPAYDYSGGRVSSHFPYETGISLGSGADGIEQTIAGLQPNTTYEVRGFLRAGSSGQSVRLGVKDYGGADSYQEAASTSWTEEKFTFTTGASSTSATVYGYKPSTGGYAFVDDVSVVATGAQGNPQTPSGMAEDFESTAVGAMPGGWTTDASGGTVSVQQVADGGNTANHALTLTQSSYGTAGDSAAATFSPVTGTAVIQVRARADQTNALSDFILMDGSGSSVAQFGFLSSGKFGYVDPTLGWVDTTTSYMANQWYDVRVTVDLTAGTYDVSIDGTTVLSNKPLLSAASDVSQIQFGTNQWYLGTVHFDNVQIAAADIYAEDFESTAAGSMPAGWTTDASGGTVSVQQVADGGNTANHALSLTQSSYGTAEDSAATTFSSVTGTANIQVRMRADQANALSDFTLMDSGGTAIAQFGFMSSGKFGYVDPSLGWVDTVTSYSANQWYDVRAIVDLTAGTYDISIDGSTVLSNKPLLSAASNVAQIQFGTNLWYPGTVHFDNVEVTR
ncbi:hypothetical protein [Cohnella zeiphila]|uniref:Right handed beta helix domain-containing protein n=1 Tax=Cohnella zeiphila TaxID=2761120 RepID=A0A7X0SIM8_9BACL|nr:hypothetical protein [Cohnella zeiphila]MBB6730685.1 hypothetical protein [Cohnella zeiphila]